MTSNNDKTQSTPTSSTNKATDKTVLKTEAKQSKTEKKLAALERDVKRIKAEELRDGKVSTETKHQDIVAAKGHLIPSTAPILHAHETQVKIAAPAATPSDKPASPEVAPQTSSQQKSVGLHKAHQQAAKHASAHHSHLAETHHADAALTSAASQSIISSPQVDNSLNLSQGIDLSTSNTGHSAKTQPQHTDNTNISFHVKEDTPQHSVSGRFSPSDRLESVTWSTDNLIGRYGTLTLDTHSGQWQYTLNNNISTTNALKEGERHNEHFTIVGTDSMGHQLSRNIVVEVEGSNDLPSISGKHSGALNELGPVDSVQGQLAALDPDHDDKLNWQVSTDHSHLGQLTLDAKTGAWLYHLDNQSAATLALTKGQQVTEHFIVSATDSSGHASFQAIDINITGRNETAEISHTQTSVLKEDIDAVKGQLNIEGQLTIVDPDAGENHFKSQQLHSELGLLTIDSQGHWSFSADNHQAAIQSLAGNEHITEHFTIHSLDGTAQDISVTISGTDDAATISGTSTAILTEDKSIQYGLLRADGQLSIQDVDHGEARFIARDLQGQFGELSLNSQGHWTYTANNQQDAIQHLGENESIIDNFTVNSADGTPHKLSVTINGTNDTPTLLSIAAIQAHEEGNLINGQLNATDKDFHDSLSYTIDGNPDEYIAFHLDADGHYSINPNDAIFAHLAQGDQATYHVPITVTDSQGATDKQTLTYTINGTNNKPVIDKVQAIYTHEGDNVVTGQLTSTDIDDKDLVSYSPAQPMSLPHGFVLHANGSYSFDPSFPVYNALAVGETLHFDIPVTATDKLGATSETSISLTIIGTNDIPQLDDISAKVIHAGHHVITGKLSASDFDLADTHTYIDNSINMHFSADVKLNGQTFSTSSDLNASLINGRKQSARSVHLHIPNSENNSESDDTGSSTNKATFTLADNLHTAPGLTLHADGTYSIDPRAPIFAQLDVKESITFHVPVTVLDNHGASDTKILTYTVVGENDAPVFSPISLQTAFEGGNIIQGHFTSTDADVDDGAYYFIEDFNHAPAGFNLTTNGYYQIDPSDPAFEHLAQGESLTLHVKVSVADGLDKNALTDSQVLTYTVYGTNDKPVINAIKSTSFSEGDAAYSGHIEATDADTHDTLTYTIANPDHIPAGFTLHTDGSYSINPKDPAFDHLALGDSFVQNVGIKVMDSQGATDTKTLSFTIHGTNDAPSLSQVATTNLNEGTKVVHGQLTSVDLDAKDSAIYTLAHPENTPAGFSLNIDGSYSIDPSNSAFEHLAAGDKQSFNIPVVVTDSTGATDSKNLVFTIHGTDDKPVVTGATSVSIEAFNQASITGTLMITDVDEGQNPHFTDFDAVNTQYGQISMAGGSWTYKLGQSSSSKLEAGEHLSDSYTFTATDGTKQTLSIDIVGQNNEFVVTSTKQSLLTNNADIHNEQVQLETPQHLVTADNLIESSSHINLDASYQTSSFTATPNILLTQHETGLHNQSITAAGMVETDNNISLAGSYQESSFSSPENVVIAPEAIKIDQQTISASHIAETDNNISLAGSYQESSFSSPENVVIAPEAIKLDQQTISASHIAETDNNISLEGRYQESTYKAPENVVIAPDTIKLDQQTISASHIAETDNNISLAGSYQESSFSTPENVVIAPEAIKFDQQTISASHIAETDNNISLAGSYQESTYKAPENVVIAPEAIKLDQQTISASHIAETDNNISLAGSYQESTYKAPENVVIAPDTKIDQQTISASHIAETDNNISLAGSYQESTYKAPENVVIAPEAIKIDQQTISASHIAETDNNISLAGSYQESSFTATPNILLAQPEVSLHNQIIATAGIIKTSNNISLEGSGNLPTAFKLSSSVEIAPAEIKLDQSIIHAGTVQNLPNSVNLEGTDFNGASYQTTSFNAPASVEIAPAEIKLDQSIIHAGTVQNLPNSANLDGTDFNGASYQTTSFNTPLSVEIAPAEIKLDQSIIHAGTVKNLPNSVNLDGTDFNGASYQTTNFNAPLSVEIAPAEIKLDQSIIHAGTVQNQPNSANLEGTDFNGASYQTTSFNAPLSVEIAPTEIKLDQSIIHAGTVQNLPNSANLEGTDFNGASYQTTSFNAPASVEIAPAEIKLDQSIIHAGTVQNLPNSANLEGTDFNGASYQTTDFNAPLSVEIVPAEIKLDQSIIDSGTVKNLPNSLKLDGTDFNGASYQTTSFNAPLSVEIAPAEIKLDQSIIHAGTVQNLSNSLTLDGTDFNGASYQTTSFNAPASVEIAPAEIKLDKSIIDSGTVQNLPNNANLEGTDFNGASYQTTSFNAPLNVEIAPTEIKLDQSISHAGTVQNLPNSVNLDGTDFNGASYQTTSFNAPLNVEIAPTEIKLDQSIIDSGTVQNLPNSLKLDGTDFNGASYQTTSFNAPLSVEIAPTEIKLDQSIIDSGTVQNLPNSVNLEGTDFNGASYQTTSFNAPLSVEIAPAEIKLDQSISHAGTVQNLPNSANLEGTDFNGASYQTTSFNAPLSVEIAPTEIKLDQSIIDSGTVQNLPNSVNLEGTDFNGASYQTTSFNAPLSVEIAPAEIKLDQSIINAGTVQNLPNNINLEGTDFNGASYQTTSFNAPLSVEIAPAEIKLDQSIIHAGTVQNLPNSVNLDGTDFNGASYQTTSFNAPLSVEIAPAEIKLDQSISHAGTVQNLPNSANLEGTDFNGASYQTTSFNAPLSVEIAPAEIKLDQSISHAGTVQNLPNNINLDGTDFNGASYQTTSFNASSTVEIAPVEIKLDQSISHAGTVQNLPNSVNLEGTDFNGASYQTTSFNTPLSVEIAPAEIKLDQSIIHTSTVQNLPNSLTLDGTDFNGASYQTTSFNAPLSVEIAPAEIKLDQSIIHAGTVQNLPNSLTLDGTDFNGASYQTTSFNAPLSVDIAPVEIKLDQSIIDAGTVQNLPNSVNLEGTDFNGASYQTTSFNAPASVEIAPAEIKLDQSIIHAGTVQNLPNSANLEGTDFNGASYQTTSFNAPLSVEIAPAEIKLDQSISHAGTVQNLPNIVNLDASYQTTSFNAPLSVEIAPAETRIDQQSIRAATVQYLPNEITIDSNYQVNRLQTPSRVAIELNDVHLSPIVIQGNTDVETISGQTAGYISVDNQNGVGGDLTINTTDLSQQPHFIDVDHGQMKLGEISMHNDHWQYSFNQSNATKIGVNGQATDSYTFTATDGTKQMVTINILGVDHPSTVTGTLTGSLTTGEQATFGQLTITDIDAGQNPSFIDVNPTATKYGQFDMHNGGWSYNLDQQKIHQIKPNEHVKDSYTFTATDGTKQTVTIDIIGEDHPATVSGAINSSMTTGEQATLGELHITDIDAGQNPSFIDVNPTATKYGQFDMHNGGWSYSLDQQKIHQIKPNEHVKDSYTFTATDGTKQTVTIDILGEDHPATVTGAINSSMTTGEQATLGELQITDIDAGQNPSFIDVNPTATKYGQFDMHNGGWSYTLDQQKIHQIKPNEHVKDSYTFTATDGTKQTVTIDILGEAHHATVTGDLQASLTATQQTIFGELIITDADASQKPSFIDVDPVATKYGQFDMQNGDWSYSLDQQKIQQIKAKEHVKDSYTFSATDGTQQTVTIDIEGVELHHQNRAVTGNTTATLTQGEAGDFITASGRLDIHSGSYDTFRNVVYTEAKYGSFSMRNGDWNYTLDNDKVQALPAHTTVYDNYTFISTNGIKQQVSITIKGLDDKSVITSTVRDAAGMFKSNNVEVDEKNVGDTSTTEGTLTITDVDKGQNPSFADISNVATKYGHITMKNGHWVYTLDQAKVQYLSRGDTVEDHYTFTATDGNQQQINISIKGQDDNSLVTGDTTGQVSEKSLTELSTAEGQLNINNVDNYQNPKFDDVIDTAGRYGYFSMQQGHWKYTLNQHKVQALSAGEHVQDHHTFIASDATRQTVNIDITGSDTPPVVSGTYKAKVSEKELGDKVTAQGNLKITDADHGQKPTFADVKNAATQYGHISMKHGHWHYDLDESKVQQLSTGEHAKDSHTFTASDGTEQVVTIDIIGNNDAPTISSHTVKAVEGSDYHISLADIGFKDIDTDDKLASITVYGQPNSHQGLLKFNGQAILRDTNHTIQAADIDKLTFTPVNTFKGHSQFHYTVNDGHTNSQQGALTFNVVEPMQISGDLEKNVTGAEATHIVEYIHDFSAMGYIHIRNTATGEGYGAASHLKEEGQSLHGQFGTITFDKGSSYWEYTLDKSHFSQARAGQSFVDSFTIHTIGGEDSQTVTVKINHPSPVHPTHAEPALGAPMPEAGSNASAISINELDQDATLVSGAQSEAESHLDQHLFTSTMATESHPQSAALQQPAAASALTTSAVDHYLQMVGITQADIKDTASQHTSHIENLLSASNQHDNNALNIESHEHLPQASVDDVLLQDPLVDKTKHQAELLSQIDNQHDLTLPDTAHDDQLHSALNSMHNQW